MSAEELDPLQITREICSRSHSYPSGLELLDEVPIHVVINDFLEAGKPRKIWANAPWLEYSKQTLQEFQDYDFAANVAAPVKKVMYEVGQQVQIGRKLSNIKINLYPLDKPVPVIVMHQPLMIESREHPLLLQSQWNNFSPDDDRSTMADPLRFEFKGNICKRAHRFPEALELLNELPTYFIVYDFRDPTRPDHLWASSAWLHALTMTQKEFQAARFATVTPERINQELHSILRNVQHGRNVLSFECVLDCLDPPVTAQAVLRPILFTHFEHAMVLCTFVPLEATVAKQQASKNTRKIADTRFHLFEKQVMFLLDEGATIFDATPGPAFGTACWCNWCSANEYGVVHDCTHLRTPDGTAMDLRMVLRSFVWDEDEDEEDVWRQLAGMAFDAHPLVKTARKQQQGGKPLEKGGGQPVWHKLTFAPCKNPHNGRNCLLLLESDVSSLLAAQAELQAKNDLKDQFLQCMSHELRTPLSGIIGLSSALAVSPQAPQQLQRALQTIERSALQLNALVTDMLETSACMARDFALHYSQVSLAAASERVCDSLRPRLNPGVELRNCIAAVASDGLVVEADEDRVHKALWHLIENAVKFTTHGLIEVSGRVDNDEVTVLVTDTGCGIQEHMLERVWQHFQQGDMSSTRKHGGTGLGLALVKLIVKAHGGRVSGTSRQWEGGGTSTFGFTLPVRRLATPFTALVSLDARARGAGDEWNGEAEDGMGTMDSSVEREGGGGAEGSGGCDAEEGGRVTALEEELRRKTERVGELEQEVKGMRGEEDGARKREKAMEARLEGERAKVRSLEAAQQTLLREQAEMASKLTRDAATIQGLRRSLADLQQKLDRQQAERGEQRTARAGDEEGQSQDRAHRGAGDGLAITQPPLPRGDGGLDAEAGGAGEKGGCEWCSKMEKQLERAMRVLSRVRAAQVEGQMEQLAAHGGRRGAVAVGRLAVADVEREIGCRSRSGGGPWEYS